MIGFRFSEYIPEVDTRTDFEKLLELFLELLMHTNGDVDEALDWMEQILSEQNFLNNDFSFEEFKKKLEEKTIIISINNKKSLAAKGEQLMRKRALDQIFGNIKRSNLGNHNTNVKGVGDEATSERRAYQYGDQIHQIDFTTSIKNSQIRSGIDQFTLSESDLEVIENSYKSQMSTVLMIDISHSMILYGEDRITPAKRVAMALAEFITTRYPKDTLDIVVFGNDAWEVPIKELPYLQVGPYHTNTVAGLELAMDLLRRRRNKNKQIFMITDGKPTCLKLKDGSYYKNPGYQDPRIVNKTIDIAIQCRRIGIPITTFMVTEDPYLQQFVEEFTEANQGKAFYSGLDGLGAFIFSDYENNKRRKR